MMTESDIEISTQQNPSYISGIDLDPERSPRGESEERKSTERREERGYRIQDTGYRRRN